MEQPSLIADQYAKCVRAKISVNFAVKGAARAHKEHEYRRLCGRQAAVQHTLSHVLGAHCELMSLKISSLFGQMEKHRISFGCHFCFPSPHSLSHPQLSLILLHLAPLPFRFSIDCLKVCNAIFMRCHSF